MARYDIRRSLLLVCVLLGSLAGCENAVPSAYSPFLRDAGSHDPDGGGGGDSAPIALVSDRTVQIGTTVVVPGNLSFDPDGEALSFAWTLTSTPVGSSATLSSTAAVSTSLTPDVEGEYLLELIVSDGTLTSAPATAVISAQTDPVYGGGLFDPSEVYIWGTLSEGACYRDMISHWSTPNVGSTGFPCYADAPSASIRSDGVIVYADSSGERVHEYQCDYCYWTSARDVSDYPNDPLANDPTLSIPNCANPRMVQLGITGDTMQLCFNTWYSPSGVALPDLGPLDPINLGHGGMLLTRDGVVDVSDGSLTPFSGLPYGTVHTARVIDADTWRVVFEPTGLGAGDLPERWTITTAGVATYEGQFPARPSGLRVYMSSAKLDGDGDLFERGYHQDGSADDVVVRSNFGGSATIVYDEGTDPLIKMHISDLITGL